jgi:asparagine synthase (glutamine-hydrolysing)
MHVLNEKYLLKQASRGLIPPGILSRPKQPYRAPDAVAFLGADRPTFVSELLDEPVLRDFGYFDPVKVKHLTRKIAESVQRGRPVSHRDSLTWVTVLSTQAWHRLFQEQPERFG